MSDMTIARSELILGGQKSGKTARAESLAAAWLARSPVHRAVYIATAQVWDEEMRERIARHQRDRAGRVPRMATVEAPLHVVQAISQHSRDSILIVVDCLTLWLTGQLMPVAAPEEGRAAAATDSERDVIVAAALKACAGPLVLVSNEIGLGVIPLGREVRAFVDALGRLNQQAAAACERVTLMSAGLPLTLKGSA